MYRLTTDNDSHWYVIPVAKGDEWESFLDDRDDPEAPEWAVRIGGSPSLVSFEHYFIEP